MKMLAEIEIPFNNFILIFILMDLLSNNEFNVYRRTYWKK